ncbi:F-box-like domain superfamily [Arabidopsis thaliana x Arabidopsis arenosa]|uniref:F-box-like domain superfamily n=1 Tax=Arabidopsis thaliana x Arabidopsis arenosa TaxID=1240361 RepID=A0A8T1ZPJ7_9BRAS|nr:F-box-like domain superfamily [Arabidopsis thaliana x Arabidopsis arenosa]
MDRISSLPDELLCHILAFFTTKEAALTSVLSKRWLNLWTLVPNLEIDDSAFLHPEEGKRERDEILQSFMDFVDRVLAVQGDSPIKKFSLKCQTGIDTDRVNPWICNVLHRGVSDLELFLEFPRYNYDSPSEDEYFLPKEMFVSRTLVELKLRSKFGVDWWRGSRGTFLPMLKSLDINTDRISLGEKLEMFLPSFPVLEELYMADFDWSESDESASSTCLRKLTIYGGFDDLKNLKSISFDTPSLVFLDYSDFVAEDYPTVNLTNLVDARLNLIVSDDQIELIRAPNDENEVLMRLRNVWKLISGIRNVQKLCFSADTLELLSLCCESIPVFNNLKFLRIKSNEDRGWQAMPVLLRNCPHLETLVLEGLLHNVTDKCGDACDCISREDKGGSLLSCPVKKLHVRGFRGTIREKEMIRHFLESFPCLEEMEIDAEENDSTNVELPKVLKIVYNLHEEDSTEIVRCQQLFSYGSSIQSGDLSQTQMDEIYFEFAPRNKGRIYDMFIIMHGASSPVPPPPPQEMSQDYLQMQLDAANAKLAELKERQRDQEAKLAGYEAMFDMIVDQNPMLASALRAREANDSERAKASSGQEDDREEAGL